MRVRRTAVLLLATGTACILAGALPLVPATADGEPGSGLGSFALSAAAPVADVRFGYPAQQCTDQEVGTAGCEGVINESVSQLTNGPVGYALSSVVWPGTLAGNIGTLLVVASGGKVPSSATALNDPVRAESHTGGTNPVVNDYPGNGAPTLAHMVADAEATKVTAEATVGSVTNVTVGSLGASTSKTSVALTGVKSATAQADSHVQDITIAGVVHLGSVTSTATAMTDGTTAKGTGHTTVTGATIAGVPVSIDDRGVTVQTQHVPVPSQATDTVNTALQNIGMRIAVSQPYFTKDGASIVYTAGSVVLYWQPPAAPAPVPSPPTLTVVLGGAQVSVKATNGFSFGCPTCPPLTGGTTGGTTGAVAGPPPITPGSVATTGGTVPPPAIGGTPQIAPQLASNPLSLPHGLSPWLGVLAVLGSGLVMAGLRRLPDRVLVASATACPNGES